MNALRRLKRPWRKAWIRLLVRVAGGRRGPLPPWDDGARAERVLFLQPKRLGDLILTTAALRAIRAARPRVRLDVLAAPASIPVLRHNDDVSEIIPFEKGRPWRYAGVVRRLRQARYDAVVDGVVLAPSTTNLLLMLGCRAVHRIALAGREGPEDDLTTVPVRVEPGVTHIAERLGTLATAFGADWRRTDWRPHLPLDPHERALGAETWDAVAGAPGSLRLLVNVSARHARRAWPDARYVAVLRHLRERHPGARLLVIGGPDDAARAARIAGAGGAVFVPTPGIRHAFALVAGADFVLTPDTSITHAASAFARPGVVMCRPGYSKAWGLYRTKGRDLESPGDRLATLPLEPVLRAVDEVLDAVRPAAAPAGTTPNPAGTAAPAS
jgi:ADP-heptose:LPS heptosyltransferase